jgi:hypothetical protein
VHKPDKKYGYYETSASRSPNRNCSSPGWKKLLGKGVAGEDPCSSGLPHDDDSVCSTRSSRKRGRPVSPDPTLVMSHDKSPMSSSASEVNSSYSCTEAHYKLETS